MARKRDVIRLTDASFLQSRIADSKPGECPYTLFLGAGASVTSGIKAVGSLIEDWRKEVFCAAIGATPPLPAEKMPDYQVWLETEYPEWLENEGREQSSTSEYGTLMQCMGRTRPERQMVVEKIIDGKKPSPGYYFLAGLMTKRYFDRVLTTNFDDLVAEALTFYREKPIVCSFDSNVSSVNLGSIRPKIIKLHGDYLFDNVKNIDDETLILGDNMESKLIEMCEDKGMIVAGYSGYDESVMAPIRENLRRNKKFLTQGLHWLIRSKPDARQDSISVNDLSPLLVELLERYPGKVFLYKYQGFDEFFQSVFDRLGPEKVSMAPGIESPMAQNVANDFLLACRKLQQFGGTLTTGMKQHRRYVLKQVSNTAHAPETSVQFAHDSWEKGKECEDKNDFEGARNCHQAALEIATQIIENSDSVPLDTRLDAISRRLGASLAIIRVAEFEKDDLSEELENAIGFLGAEKNLESRVRSDEDIDMLASVAYNSLCLLGRSEALKAGMNIKLESDVEHYLRILESSSIGSVKLRRILNSEPDCTSIQELLLTKLKKSASEVN